MRLPIKLNGAGWPSVFSRLAITPEDPRILARDFAALSPEIFAAMVSVLKFGSTFKSTRPGRHEHSNHYLLDVYHSTKPAILDIGSSEGSTALDLIRTLKDNFRHFFVTDLNMSVRCDEDNYGVMYFMDGEEKCILRVSRRWLAYADTNGSWFPFGWLAKKLLIRSKEVTHCREVLLIQPGLLRLCERDARITLVRYDMFTPWVGERPDLIKLANILNSSYFSEAQLRRAIEVQCSNLAADGRLLIIDNRNDLERFSVFRKTSIGMRLEYEHGGGAEASVYV
jgi:hypothetical protein